MASDQIMIYDHAKLKIFESGILLGIMQDVDTRRSLELESLREKWQVHK